MNKMKYVYAGLIVTGFAVLLNAMAYVIVRPSEEKQIQIPTYENIMRQQDAESIMSIIETEGFDNTFNHYTTFRDISDHRFHELRRSYINASQQLKDYLVEAANKENEVPYYLRIYTNENRN